MDSSEPFTDGQSEPHASELESDLRALDPRSARGGEPQDILDGHARSEGDATFHVVGVGASAGGLEALERLFSNMPEDTGMAFVVVQHLSPDFKSVMDELLARRTKIPVLLVENGMSVEPNRIYLIPPRKEMIIAGGRLLLSDKGASQELTLPIDIFFRSLAQDMGYRAIGIVLSGAGSDGARGIRDIHDAGGLVLCQDEASADFDGMPRSARDTGIVDHVLPPGEMPQALVDYARSPVSRSLAESLGGNPARPYGVSAALRFLQNAYGIDFSHYKPSTVVRRIERRLQLTQAPDLEAYVERISADTEEMDALFHDLLIGVTRFFRDREAFERLEFSVIPALLDRTEKKSEEVRVWIAGCATGEEAYSIGILVQEALNKRNDRRRLKILATDVHRGSLDFASRGLYSEDRVAHVRPDLLERYFDRRGPNYQVSPELRQLVVFAPHNVIKDAPFTRIDFISCRNLLIYLQPPAQKRVLSLLHFALKRQGVLFLGPSENVGILGDDFETVDAHWRIYRKQRDLRFAATDARVVAPQSRMLSAASAESSANASYSLTQVINVYDALLDEHMPPSLLVNERRELVHAFNGAGRYLKVRDGRPSADVLDMLGPDLKMAMTGAMQRALKDGVNVTYDGLRFLVGSEERAHRLSVKPILTPGAPLKHLLITIDPMDSIPPAAPHAGATAQLDLSQVSRDQLGSLESELRRTKESLQATIEELETSNEELQAANEELLASNEELQSTNEELQSVNEELYTVNAEYQKKIRELTELTNDMDNLLASIEVGTIFLDRKLCIRKFTPRIAEAFNLLPQDIGRPLGGFTSSLLHPELLEQLSAVLETERSIEKEIRDRNGNWFFLRILPYRARGAVDGVVLTLVDVNALKAAENAVFRERYLLNSLMDSVPDIIYFKDRAERFIRINKALAERGGLKDPTLAAGKTASELGLPSELPPRDPLDRTALQGEPQPYKEEQYPAPSGGVTWFLATRQPLRDTDGGIVGMLGVARDISEQKRAEEQIRLAIRRRDEFLAMLSHELRNPLAAIVNASILLNQSQPLSPGQTKSLDVIERQSRQMTRLLDDLLEVGRITQNKIALRKEVIDARSVIQEAAIALREKFAARRVVLALELSQEPVWVDADPARLQQIIVNLLDNASKYNRPDGHAQLSLRTEGEQAVLRVTDDGEGIESHLCDSIFEPFVQGRATIHRTEGGMGVGLSVVRSLVQMHGGSVEAKSKGRGHGCEFIVRLPLSAPPTQEPVSRTHVPWPAGSRVVVVEDNLDGCEMMELLLERAGYEVFAAHDGKAGLELILREKPDFALVDIGLPLMDGFELARRVREATDGHAPYMVALTGYGQAADHAAALDAGFNEHLVKPLDPNDLERLLRRGRGTPSA
jgi:two-component system CheB/CheR fusion protein